MSVNKKIVLKDQNHFRSQAERYHNNIISISARCTDPVPEVTINGWSTNSSVWTVREPGDTVNHTCDTGYEFKDVLATDALASADTTDDHLTTQRIWECVDLGNDTDGRELGGWWNGNTSLPVPDSCESMMK